MAASHIAGRMESRAKQGDAAFPTYLIALSAGKLLPVKGLTEETGGDPNIGPQQLKAGLVVRHLVLDGQPQFRPPLFRGQFLIEGQLLFGYRRRSGSWCLVRERRPEVWGGVR